MRLPKSTDEITAAACATCGAPRTGLYCAACGQRAVAGRHTVRGLVGGAVARLFDLDRGLVHTIHRLTIDPGGVVRDYLAGRTVIYLHPVVYLVLAFAAFALTAHGVAGASGGDDRIFFGVIVVFLAAVSRLVFLRKGLNFAEHFILNTFLTAHAVVLLTVALLGLYLVPQSAALPAMAIALAAACGYVVWGYSRVFLDRPVWAALGGAVVLALGTAAWFLTLMLLLRLRLAGPGG